MEELGDFQNSLFRLLLNIIVTLDKNLRMSPPESVVDKNLMDHPGTDNFLKALLAFVHQ